MEGSRPDMRVRMREIRAGCRQPPVLAPKTTRQSQFMILRVLIPIRMSRIDLLKGLPDLRAAWIEERNDTEQLDGPSSEFGQQRAE